MHLPNYTAHIFRRRQEEWPYPSLCGLNCTRWLKCIRLTLHCSEVETKCLLSQNMGDNFHLKNGIFFCCYYLLLPLVLIAEVPPKDLLGTSVLL